MPSHLLLALLLENIIRPITKRDHQWHSGIWDWGSVCQMMWSCEWEDFNVCPSHAVTGEVLPLPDVIKETWSSELQRGAFWAFPSLCQGAGRYTWALTLSRHSLSAATPDAGTLGGYTGKLSQWIKKLFLSPFGLALEDTPLIWEGELTLATPQPLRGQAKR